jgi:hypothetical protein
MGVALARAMHAPAWKPARIALVLAAAFAVGGASAEVAMRTHENVERVRNEREIGAAGQLVSLQLTSADGDVVARPRLICPTGKAAELVLHDPKHPDQVRLTFRVEAEREATGEIALDYELWIPERSVAAKGKLSLTPGAEQAIRIGDGELIATWLALPVPSAQFDAYIEAERAAARAGKTT